MAYNSNNPYGNSNRRPNLAPIHPSGYGDVAHPPPSPHMNSPAYGYDNADIQDDPYAQNPNLPPGRFYGAGMQGYSRNSLAASEVSLQHPQGSSVSLGSPYADTPRGGSTASFAKGFAGGNYDAYKDDPDAHQMAYLGESRKFEKNDPYGARIASSKGSGSRRKVVWVVIIAIIILLAAAGVCVYIFIIKPKETTSSSGSSNSTTGSTYNWAKTGGNGSVVLKDDNTTFTYSNNFGGFWVYDPNNPFNDSAQAQSYTPALNQPWDYTHRIRGVNLGGWLVLEPFIAPAMFEMYAGTVDEYTLSQAMAKDTTNGGFDNLRNHYATFITEEDFAAVAGAGLNWVRIPLAFWAFETYPDEEPYLPKESWQWFLKAIQWARKYGLRINLDFHAVPGSQNGWNHSGHLGDINFLIGTMGLANAQRTLSYIRMLAQFISQDQYKNVIPFFGIINEAQTQIIGVEQMRGFYTHTYDMIRSITGVGAGNGPMVSIHDGFMALNLWNDLLPNADRLALDTHFYFAFAATPSNASIPTWTAKVCTGQQGKMTASLNTFGVTGAGEFSLAINDCGLNVNNVGVGTRYEGTFPGDTHPGVGNCSTWNDWENWDAQTKSDLKNFALAEMDALYNYFFWTWKIGNTTTTTPNRVRAPFWAYQLGLEQGWMPTAATEADGVCTGGTTWAGSLSAWQTGGAGAGSTAATISSLYPWPPVEISSTSYGAGLTPTPAVMWTASDLPSYTPTGTTIVLPTPTFSGATTTVNEGNGLVNPTATESFWVPVSGCSYPPIYGGNSVGIPTPACGTSQAAKRDALATAAPQLS